MLTRVLLFTTESIWLQCSGCGCRSHWNRRHVVGPQAATRSDRFRATSFDWPI